MRICVVSKDEKLLHRFSLLPSEYTFTDLHHASLIIWDADSAPRPTVSQPILCVTRDVTRASEGDLLLLRPFSLRAPEEMLSKIREHSDTPHLSPTEERLLTVLKEAGENGIDRESLLRRVFGEKAEDSLLNVYICYLRKKLEGDGKKRIFALRGKGYRYIAHHTD